MRTMLREDGERSRLHMACRMDRATTVKLLIRDGVDIDRFDDASGKAPLHISAQLGHEACVQQLLASRADVDAPDAHGSSAIFAAAQAGHERCVQLLLLLQGFDRG